MKKRTPENPNVRKWGKAEQHVPYASFPNVTHCLFPLLHVALLLFALSPPFILLLPPHAPLPLLYFHLLLLIITPSKTKMIQALNMPYLSKRDEIMSRYRPIAPKPHLSSTDPSASAEPSLVPLKFRQSPYLRNIWSHLQARPTRTRKRGRSAGISPFPRKQRTQNFPHLHYHHHVPCAGSGFMGFSSHASNLSFNAFGVHAYRNDVNVGNKNKNIVELPLLPSPLLSESESKMNMKMKMIDLNSKSNDDVSAFEEKDLTLQLQIPTGNNNATMNVISPRPVRPVGSTISIVCPIGEDPEALPIAKSAEKVEEEAEVELLPAVISDRGNKVKMVNPAYKELVGQPECPWLDSMVSSRWGRRISGEVVFNFPNHGRNGSPVMGNGFTSWVRIEWESGDGKKNNVNAFCEVVRLACESKDYVFYWRFHTREASPSASKV